MLESLGYSSELDSDGWLNRPETDDGLFLDVYGALRARVEAPGLTRIQLTPRNGHRNMLGTIHGGFLLAIVDHALFVGPGMLGIAGIEGASTIDATAQFLAPVQPERPIDVLVETLRETYRMVFVRGMIEQDGVRSVAFSGTIKKASQRK